MIQWHNNNFTFKFQYELESLNKLILFRQGLKYQKEANIAILDFCNECYSFLSRNKMPKFALANKLYRGTLPNEFCGVHSRSVRVGIMALGQTSPDSKDND